MVTIPRRYWTGTETIATRTPWLVPQAILALDRWLKPTDTVLELGAGGSTLFFADRCKRVVTFEKPGIYCDVVAAAIKKEQLTQVELHVVSSEAEVLEILAYTYTGNMFSVIMPDWDEARDFLYDGLEGIVSTDCLYVLDNYAAHNLFPLYGEDLPSTLMHEPMGQVVYDDKHWYGKGTKLVYSDARGVF